MRSKVFPITHIALDLWDDENRAVSSPGVVPTDSADLGMTRDEFVQRLMVCSPSVRFVALKLHGRPEVYWRISRADGVVEPELLTEFHGQHIKEQEGLTSWHSPFMSQDDGAGMKLTNPAVAAPTDYNYLHVEECRNLLPFVGTSQQSHAEAYLRDPPVLK